MLQTKRMYVINFLWIWMMLEYLLQLWLLSKSDSSPLYINIWPCKSVLMKGPPGFIFWDNSKLLSLVSEDTWLFHSWTWHALTQMCLYISIIISPTYNKVSMFLIGCHLPTISPINLCLSDVWGEVFLVNLYFGQPRLSSNEQEHLVVTVKTNIKCWKKCQESLIVLQLLPRESKIFHCLKNK